MRICIRTRVMRLMSDRAYVYAYGEVVHIRAFGPRDREDQSNQSTSLRSIQSNTLRLVLRRQIGGLYDF